MYTSRGSPEIPSLPNDPKVVHHPLNPSSVSSVPPKPLQHRFLLQYQPSEYLYPWNTYQSPQRSPMNPQRRQINNGNYFPRRNNGFAPYYNPRIQNQGYHPTLMKRWNLFHHATEAPVNTSLSTSITPEQSQNKNITGYSSSTEAYLNSSTNFPPLTPSDEDYNAQNIQNRDAPVWQVPDDSSPQEPLPLYQNYGLGSLDSPDYQEQNVNLDENSNLKNLEISNSLDPPSKFKRGFRLLPVSNNLYVLKQDAGDPQPGNVNDNQKTGDLKRSNPQFDEGTADLLSFRAHMHHRVEDIGKRFLRRAMKKDVVSSGAEPIGDNVDTLSSGLDGSWDPLSDSSPLGPSLDDPNTGLQGPVDPLKAQQFQYQDPLLNPLESNPQNVRMYDTGNSYSGLDPYQPHPVLTKSLYQSNPNLQTNFYPPPAQSNQWNPNYLSLNSLSSLEDGNQQNPAEEYNSVVGNNLDDLERGPRGDSEVPEEGHLGYLDKYARAVDSINANWNVAQQAGDGGESSSVDSINETPAPANAVNGQLETSESPKPEGDSLNGTSLAMVIEPLTAQLQKLLSSIQQVNEKLMSDQSTHDNLSAMDSLRKKRGVDKDSVPEDEFYDDIDEDQDDEEETREERSDDDDQNDNDISCPPGSSRNGKRCSMPRHPHARPSKSDKKIDFEAEDSSNNSSYTSHPQEIRKNQKESNSSIVSFFQKTFGMEKTTPVPSKTTWSSMSMSLATDPEETTLVTPLREHFVNPGFMNGVGEAVGSKTTIIVSNDNTGPPITSKIPLYPEEEQTRVPEMQEMIKTTPVVMNPPTTTPQQPETRQENLQKAWTVPTSLETPAQKKMAEVSNYETLKSVESVAGAKGLIDTTISPLGDVETIRVAIEPLPDSSNENKIPNQLIRTNSKDLLMKLLPPEIIQNITDNGIIVRVPGDNNLRKTATFSTSSTSRASGDLQGNSLWLFEGRGHINNPQESRKAVESRSDVDGSVKSRGSDAMVAVGDDDEEEGDTKLTIRLRLPNRGHSAHTLQQVQRNVDDKLNHKPEEFPQKTLTKRSEPVDNLDEESDEDYQNIDKRNIDKIGNEYVDDLEEEDGEFEDYDDEEPEEKLKNVEKRSDEAAGGSPASVPKIVLRLRFPEASEAPSDVPLKKSSGLKDEKKKRQQVIKKSPKRNGRIGRSLKWVMDEPEEHEGRFAREIDLLNLPGAVNLGDNEEKISTTTEGASAVMEATAYSNMVGMLGSELSTGEPPSSVDGLQGHSTNLSESIESVLSTEHVTTLSLEISSSPPLSLSSVLSTSTEESSKSSLLPSVQTLGLYEKSTEGQITTETITESSSSSTDKTETSENNKEINSESTTTERITGTFGTTTEIPTLQPVISEETESISTQTSEKIFSTEETSQPSSSTTTGAAESVQTFVNPVLTSGISEKLSSTSGVLETFAEMSSTSPSTSEKIIISTSDESEISTKTVEEISSTPEMSETSTTVLPSTETSEQISTTEMLETHAESSEKIDSTSDMIETSTETPLIEISSSTETTTLVTSTTEEKISQTTEFFSSSATTEIPSTEFFSTSSTSLPEEITSPLMPVTSEKLETISTSQGSLGTEKMETNFFTTSEISKNIITEMGELITQGEQKFETTLLSSTSQIIPDASTEIFSLSTGIETSTEHSGSSLVPLTSTLGTEIEESTETFASTPSTSESTLFSTISKTVSNFFSTLTTSEIEPTSTSPSTTINSGVVIPEEMTESSSLPPTFIEKLETAVVTEEIKTSAASTFAELQSTGGVTESSGTSVPTTTEGMTLAMMTTSALMEIEPISTSPSTTLNSGIVTPEEMTESSSLPPTFTEKLETAVVTEETKTSSASTFAEFLSTGDVTESSGTSVPTTEEIPLTIITTLALTESEPTSTSPSTTINSGIVISEEMTESSSLPPTFTEKLETAVVTEETNTSAASTFTEFQSTGDVTESSGTSVPTTTEAMSLTTLMITTSALTDSETTSTSPSTTMNSGVVIPEEMTESSSLPPTFTEKLDTTVVTEETKTSAASTFTEFLSTGEVTKSSGTSVLTTTEGMTLAMITTSASTSTENFSLKTLETTEFLSSTEKTVESILSSIESTTETAEGTSETFLSSSTFEPETSSAELETSTEIITSSHIQSTTKSTEVASTPISTPETSEDITSEENIESSTSAPTVKNKTSKKNPPKTTTPFQTSEVTSESTENASTEGEEMEEETSELFSSTTLKIKTTAVKEKVTSAKQKGKLSTQLVSTLEASSESNEEMSDYMNESTSTPPSTETEVTESEKPRKTSVKSTSSLVSAPSSTPKVTSKSTESATSPETEGQESFEAISSSTVKLETSTSEEETQTEMRTTSEVPEEMTKTVSTQISEEMTHSTESSESSSIFPSTKTTIPSTEKFEGTAESTTSTSQISEESSEGATSSDIKSEESSGAFSTTAVQLETSTTEEVTQTEMKTTVRLTSTVSGLESTSEITDETTKVVSTQTSAEMSPSTESSESSSIPPSTKIRIPSTDELELTSERITTSQISEVASASTAGETLLEVEDSSEAFSSTAVELETSTTEETQTEMKTTVRSTSPISGLESTSEISEETTETVSTQTSEEMSSSTESSELSSILPSTDTKMSSTEELEPTSKSITTSQTSEVTSESTEGGTLLEVEDSSEAFSSTTVELETSTAEEETQTEMKTTVRSTSTISGLKSTSEITEETTETVSTQTSEEMSSSTESSGLSSISPSNETRITSTEQLEHTSEGIITSQTSEVALESIKGGTLIEVEESSEAFSPTTVQLETSTSEKVTQTTMKTTVRSVSTVSGLESTSEITEKTTEAVSTQTSEEISFSTESSGSASSNFSSTETRTPTTEEFKETSESTTTSQTSEAFSSTAVELDATAVASASTVAGRESTSKITEKTTETVSTHTSEEMSPSSESLESSSNFPSTETGIPSIEEFEGTSESTITTSKTSKVAPESTEGETSLERKQTSESSSVTTATELESSSRTIPSKPIHKSTTAVAEETTEFTSTQITSEEITQETNEETSESPSAETKIGTTTSVSEETSDSSSPSSTPNMITSTPKEEIQTETKKVTIPPPTSPTLKSEETSEVPSTSEVSSETQISSTEVITSTTKKGTTQVHTSPTPTSTELEEEISTNEEEISTVTRVVTLQPKKSTTIESTETIGTSEEISTEIEENSSESSLELTSSTAEATETAESTLPKSKKLHTVIGFTRTTIPESTFESITEYLTPGKTTPKRVIHGPSTIAEITLMSIVTPHSTESTAESSTTTQIPETTRPEISTGEIPSSTFTAKEFSSTTEEYSSIAEEFSSTVEFLTTVGEISSSAETSSLTPEEISTLKTSTVTTEKEETSTNISEFSSTIIPTEETFIPETTPLSTSTKPEKISTQFSMTSKKIEKIEMTPEQTSEFSSTEFLSSTETPVKNSTLEVSTSIEEEQDYYGTSTLGEGEETSERISPSSTAQTTLESTFTRTEGTSEFFTTTTLSSTSVPTSELIETTEKVPETSSQPSTLSSSPLAESSTEEITTFSVSPSSTVQSTFESTFPTSETTEKISINSSLSSTSVPTSELIETTEKVPETSAQPSTLSSSPLAESSTEEITTFSVSPSSTVQSTFESIFPTSENTEEIFRASTFASTMIETSTLTSEYTSTSEKVPETSTLTSTIFTELLSEQSSPLPTNPSSETLINTKVSPNFGSISTVTSTSIIPEDRFGIKTASTFKIPTSPPPKDSIPEPETTEDQGLAEYETEIETEASVDEKEDEYEENGSGAEGVTDFFEYSEEGVTQPWGISEATSISQSSEAATQSSKGVRQSTLTVLKTSSTPEITSESFPTTLESTQKSKATSEISQSSEIVLEISEAISIPAESPPASSESPTTSSEFLTTFSSTTEFFPSSESTEALTTLETTSVSQSPVPEVSTSPFPWETLAPTEQLTSIITEYESTAFETSLEHEKGETERTTESITLGGTEGFHSSAESLSGLVEGQTTPGFGEKAEKVEVTMEFVPDVTLPHIVEQPEKSPNDYYPDITISPESETPIPLVTSIETTPLIPGESFSTDFPSFSQGLSTKSEVMLATSPTLSLETEVLLSSIFPTEASSTESVFSPDTMSSEFTGDTKFISSSTFLPFETSKSLTTSEEFLTPEIKTTASTSGLFETLMTTSQALSTLFSSFSPVAASEITGESSPNSEDITKNPETSMENEEQLKNETQEQLDRRRKLEKRIKELEDKEHDLLDREAELRRLQEEWEREKARRQRERERLEEEKRNKKLTTTIRPTTTEIPTTTVDYAKLQELEEMKRKQSQLNDELERMEKEIADKEKELEEREKALEEEQQKYEREKEEFEKMWNEQKDMEERDKELNEKEKDLKDEEEKLEENNDENTENTESSSTPEDYTSSTYEETSSIARVEEEISTIRLQISTEIPPTESTSQPISETTSSSSTPSQLPESTHTRGEADEKPNGSSSEAYIFDENEEVWKSQSPADYDRNTPEGSDDECDDDSDFTPAIRIIENGEEKQSVLEPGHDESKLAEIKPETATKKICLHVLANEDSTATLDIDNYVTEVMCMPNYRQLQHQQRKRSRNHNSRRRRLMNSEETSTVSMDLVELDVDKRSKKILQDLKIKPIASLDLMHGEWMNNDTVVPFHTPMGFTRVYESWSQVPLEPFIFMENSVGKGFQVQDETFMRKNFQVNDFDQRIQPTQVNRLANHEWTEFPTESSRGQGTTGPDEDEEQSDEVDEENGRENESEDKRKRKRERREDEDDDLGRPTEYPPEYEENCLLRQHGPWKSERPDVDALENQEEDRNDEDQVFVEPEEYAGRDDGDKDIVDVNIDDDDEERTIPPPSDEDDFVDAKNKDESENHDEGPSDDVKDKDEPQSHEENSSDDAEDEGGQHNHENNSPDDAHDEEEQQNHESNLPDDGDKDERKERPGESQNDESEDEVVPTTSRPTPKPTRSSSRSPQPLKTTQPLPKTTVGDYGDIEYVTNNIESSDDYEDYDEGVPEGDWTEYEDTSDEKNGGKSRKREGKLLTSLQTLMDTKQILENKQKSLLRREDSLNKMEAILKHEEAQLEHLKAKRSKRKAKKNKKQVISWPTEGTDRYHLGGNEKWQSGLLEDVHKDYKKNKQAFTVNVLRLDYDEDEENHKLKCEEPDKDDLVVDQGLVTRGIEDTTLKMTPVNLEATTKEFKLHYDPNVEANVVAEENSSDVFVDKNIKPSRELKRTTKSRNPPGTEWPTEKTTKYHLGGTRSWDKELTATTEGGNYGRRMVRGGMSYGDGDNQGDDEEASDDADEEVDDIGTTCYTLLLKKEHKNVFTRKRSVEDQIPRPEDVGELEDESLKPLKPKLRTIKSITRLTTEESPNVEKNRKKNRKSEKLKVGDGVISSSLPFSSLMGLSKHQEATKHEERQLQQQESLQDIKNLPLLIKMNNSKVIRMANFQLPPKELYIMYRCGPPEIVAVFDPPKSENSNKENPKEFIVTPSATAHHPNDNEKKEGNCKYSAPSVHNSTTPKYRTIFPFNYAQISEVTDAPILAHVHGELNSSLRLSKRNSEKKRRKGKKKCHKRRGKHRHLKRKIFSLNEEISENSLNNSGPSLLISHEGFRRSLLSLKNSKGKAKSSKHHQKSHPAKKPKSKKSGKKSKKLENKKIHKRDTNHSKKMPKLRRDTPQLMNKVLSIITTPRSSNSQKPKNPRSIFDKMKQVISNVIGHDNSTTPGPRINVNRDDEEADGEESYTEIVHQSAAKFMPKDEDRHPDEVHDKHHRKKNRHHLTAHSPHHHHHHHHHHDHRIHDHLKKLHHTPPTIHPIAHHKAHPHSKPAREIARVPHLKSKMAHVPLKKPNLSSFSHALKPLKTDQNDEKSLNLSRIIPTVKNLVENQNLGSLEKIIVYVDKTEGIRKKKSTPEKSSSKKKIKHHEGQKKGLKRSKSSGKSNLEEVYFDGESLDDMISHVADKILTSVSGSSLHDLDPHLSVKVIQEVPNGAGEPHEETKSEFSINLSDSNIKKAKKSSSSSSSSSRLTSDSIKRQMNLKGAPGKKRNLWKNKIKRENIVEKIRMKLEEELKKKLSRKRRKVEVESLEDSEKLLPHHLDDLDEKIRILYAMHHKKDVKGGGNKKKKRGPMKNHKRSKREDDWRLDHRESNIFTNENDKKSLKGLIEQIINLQKNVNTTLQIIRKRLDDSSHIFARNLTRKMITDLSSSTKIKQRSIPNKKDSKKNQKKNHEKKKTSKDDPKKKKPTKKPTKKYNKKPVTSKNNKKTSKSKTKNSKKKLEKNYGDEQVDKISNEIQEILKEEGEGKISNKRNRTNRRKVRTLKGLPDEDLHTMKIGRHLCSKSSHKKLPKKGKSSNKKKSSHKKSKSTSKKTPKKSQKVIKNCNKNIREVKSLNASRSDHLVVRNGSFTSHSRSNGSKNCDGCLCDLEEVVLNLRKMLLMRNDLLDRISTYSCQKFIAIGDELILTSSGVLGDVLPRSRRQIAEAKGLKYIRPGDLEDLLRGDEVRGHEHEILSFPGSDLNVPCNHEGEEITWVMSISRPNYTWTKLDNSPISGTIRKNGNLELYDVDAKDAGNYSCIVTYIDPDNEELVENIYKHSIQIVTLPRYSLRGGNRYKMEICEEQELDILSVYLPSKLNEILCKNSICDAFIFAPHCHSHQVSIRVLIVPASPSKLFPISSSQCGLRCRKAVQDKLAFLLTQNLRIILRKTIVFRLPNRPQDKLVPVEGRFVDFRGGGRGRRAYGRMERGRGDADGEVGLLVGCPAGYGLENSHCVPCSPHYHSQDLSARCKRCPLGSHQPSIGSRVCRSCTNPFVDGCYDMLWTTSSVLLAILASLLAVILVGLIVLWTLCCGKKRKSDFSNSNFSKNEIEMSIKQPLIPPLNPCQSDDEDLIWERPKKKKKKLVKRFLRTKDEDQPLVYGINVMPRKSEKAREKMKTIPVCCIDSYRSHGGHCPECKNPYIMMNDHGARRARGRPPVPFPDFDR